MSQPSSISAQGNGQVTVSTVDLGVIDPEVVPKTSRRRFSAAASPRATRQPPLAPYAIARSVCGKSSPMHSSGWPASFAVA